MAVRRVSMKYPNKVLANLVFYRHTDRAINAVEVSLGLICGTKPMSSLLEKSSQPESISSSELGSRVSLRR